MNLFSFIISAISLTLMRGPWNVTLAIYEQRSGLCRVLLVQGIADAGVHSIVSASFFKLVLPKA